MFVAEMSLAMSLVSNDNFVIASMLEMNSEALIAALAEAARAKRETIDVKRMLKNCLEFCGRSKIRMLGLLRLERIVNYQIL